MGVIPKNPFGKPMFFGLFMLIFPPVIAFATGSFFADIRLVTVWKLAISVLYAVIKGFSEELLWRGLFNRHFPNNLLLGFLYLSIGFGLWHLAPQMIYPAGNSLLFSVMAIFLGAPFGDIVYKTKTIHWAAISHMILNLSTLIGAYAL